MQLFIENLWRKNIWLEYFDGSINLAIEYSLHSLGTFLLHSLNFIRTVTNFSNCIVILRRLVCSIVNYFWSILWNYFYLFYCNAFDTFHANRIKQKTRGVYDCVSKVWLGILRIFKVNLYWLNFWTSLIFVKSKRRTFQTLRGFCKK